MSASGEFLPTKPDHVIKRHERNYYVFQQILKTCFSGVPHSTVRRWLRDIGKSTIRTNSSERDYLKEQGENDKFLISEDDLHDLIKHSKTRRKYTKRLPQSSTDELDTRNEEIETSSFAKVPDCIMADTHATSQINSSTSSDQPSVHEISTETDQSDTRNMADKNATSQINPSTSSDQTSVHEISDVISSHAVKTVKIGCLKKEDTCLELENEFNKLGDFYTLPVNPLRSCSAFSASTMKKFLERVSCFMNYCRIEYPERTLDFTLVNDVDIVQAYITYQLEERKLNISTVVRTVTALINLVKYGHRASEDMESCVELLHLKNVQRQLSQRQKSYELAVKAGLCKEETSVFMFHHILETIKSLRLKVDQSSSDSRNHARILHDFVLISLYITCLCGRSKELRTLELFHEFEQGKEFRFDWERKYNVFVVSATEDKFTLYENDFKNLRSHGPSKFEIPDSMWLIPYLKEYIRKRNDLLRGKSHSFMFTTATGLPFTSPSFTSYLGKLFEREVNIRAGTTKLRHALVTHVLSLPESESLKLRESLATLMRHSLKHQQFTYCDISRQDKTSLSRDLLNKSIEEATNTKTSSSSHTVIPKRQDAGNSVKAGDMVALVDGATTRVENASIFLARVVRLSEDDSVALLMEFRTIPGEKSLYRAVVDSSWYESKSSLIFPVDVIYDHKREVYELRSSVAEICSVVSLQKD